MYSEEMRPQMNTDLVDNAELRKPLTGLVRYLEVSR